MSLIFLSHTEEDFSLAEGLAQGLEEAGHSTWLYERDTLPGVSYLLQITRAIESSDALVLLASAYSLTSDQVTKEVVGAFERSIPILPVLAGITAVTLKERQPEWRHALGGTAMLTAEPEDPPATIAALTDGLVSLGISPGKAEVSSTQILSTPQMHAPRALTDRVLAQREALEGERKQVTVLVAEVTGLSGLDPEDRHEIAGPLMELMSQEIGLFEGTVSSLSGEGLTAIFGAPIAHEDDPARAIHAALSLRKRLEERPEKLSLRAGAHTGLVIVGAIGDDLSMEYTAIGDTLTLASDLRDGSSPGTILISKDTRELAEGYFDFEPADKETYAVLAPKHAATRVEASLAKGLSHFVGRDRELAQLMDCFSRASEGRGQVAGIVGEAGVGKSRLILQFTQALPGEYTLLQGGCYHYGDAMPYLPILGILKGYFGIEDSDDQESAKRRIGDQLELADPEEKLQGILAPILELLSLPAEDEAYVALEPAQRRERVFAAVKQLLMAESASSPLIVIVEDLHWIDKTSEELLASLIDSMANSRIQLILLYRPEYTSPWTSKSYYTTIGVDQLPEKTSEELISSILSGGEVDADIVRLITAKASGNPLFIEELTHGLRENGSILKEDRHYLLAGKASEIEVPETIQGMIAARLDRLAAELKKLMQVASVIGREFAYRLLASITQMQDELKRSLSDLQESELIYEKSLFPELEYIFKHALTQEVAYNSLLKKRRKELHGKIGAAIETLYPERLEEFYEMLAYHYARSDDTDKAIQYLRLSGDKAARSYSHWEAVHFYKSAVGLLDAKQETEERDREKLNICLSLMNPLFLLNFPEGSLETLEEAEALSKELRDTNGLVNAYGKLGFYYTCKGDNVRGLDYAEKCFSEAEKIGEIESMIVPATDICFARFNSGEITKVRDITLKVLSVIEERLAKEQSFSGAINAYSMHCGWSGNALGSLGEFGDAREVLEKGLKNAIAANDIFGVARLQQCFFPACYFSGDAEGSLEHAQEAIKLFEDAGILYMLGYAWAFLAGGQFFSGDMEPAQANVEKGIRLQTDEGVAAMLPTVYWVAAIIHHGIGDLNKAIADAEQSLKLSQEYHMRAYESLAWGVLGRMLGEQGPLNIDVAEQHIHRSISMAEDMSLKPAIALGYLFRGEVFELAGRKEEAIENLKIAEKMGQDMGMGYWLTRTREALARLER